MGTQIQLIKLIIRNSYRNPATLSLLRHHSLGPRLHPVGNGVWMRRFQVSVERWRSQFAKESADGFEQPEGVYSGCDDPDQPTHPQRPRPTGTMSTGEPG